MSNRYDFEVAVIGSGPGGYVAAIRAAQMGKKVCLVEKEKTVGGVCLNEGCIPTKTLIKTANLYKDITNAAKFAIQGVDTEKISVSMQDLQKRRQSVVNQLVAGVGGLIRSNGVELVNGIATFKDEHTIQVGEKEITAENFIIATGSSAILPSFIKIDSDKIITSKEALLLEEIPKSMTVIGGGVIGIEFAYLYSALGSKVTVLELMDNILPMVDEEISEMARFRMEKEGIIFNTGTKVTEIKDNLISFEQGGKTDSLKSDTILMAVGRSPNTKGLGLEKLGLETDKGAIVVDKYLKTNIPNIFAIGDVNGKVMLAHTASSEGIAAIDYICGNARKTYYNRMPSCIYLDPEIASIGLTEKQAREQYNNVKIGKFPMIGNGKSLVEGDTEGIIKVILEGELEEILGVHMYGKNVTEMVAEISVAMNLESTAEEIRLSVHPHPTISEAIAEAFMDADNKAIHF